VLSIDGVLKVAGYLLRILIHPATNHLTPLSKKIRAFFGEGGEVVFHYDFGKAITIEEETWFLTFWIKILHYTQKEHAFYF
jgi:hypothetical protein